MRIRTNVLVAGSGLAVVLALGAPAVAFAGETGPTASSSSSPAGSTNGADPASCPGHDVHRAVASYLTAHPDVAAELKTIHALPAGQRAAARKAYLVQHADVAQALKQIRSQARGSWADLLAPVGDYLSAHPEVADLLTQLKNAPAGQRHQVAESYLAAHPAVQGELKGAMTSLRQHARSCRTGGS